MATSMRLSIRCANKVCGLRLCLQNKSLFKLNSHIINANSSKNFLHTQTFVRSHRHHRISRHLCRNEQNTRICSIVVRLNSTSTTTEAAQGGGAYIPLPPGASGPAPVSEIKDIVSGHEPSLSEMGLGGWTPSGLVQNGLDLLHGVFPWWASIGVGVLIIRCLIFPVVIKARKNTVSMHNFLPEMTRLQQEIQDASRKNDLIDAALLSQQLDALKAKSDFDIKKMLLIPAVQVPLFLSVFWGLTGMANLPVESMKTGGILWFTDLTVPDPFYLLPVLTTATLSLTLEVGADGVAAGNMSTKARWAMRAIPFVIFPLMLKFPAAMLCYWFTSNVISLLQVLLLKQKSFEQYFKIPKRIERPAEQKKDTRTFRQKWADQKEEAKLSHRAKNVQKFDAEAFEKAGKGPIPKTYKSPPKISST